MTKNAGTRGLDICVIDFASVGTVLRDKSVSDSNRVSVLVSKEKRGVAITSGTSTGYVFLTKGMLETILNTLSSTGG
jgi:hypothetical protein